MLNCRQSRSLGPRKTPQPNIGEPGPNAGFLAEDPFGAASEAVGREFPSNAGNIHRQCVPRNARGRLRRPEKDCAGAKGRQLPVNRCGDAGVLLPEISGSNGSKGTVSVTSRVTIKAIAYKPGMLDSTVV